jgi:AcrR family transcriptional regulator
MNKQEIKYFNTASYMDEALLFLLEKKEYEFITVKEISKKAGVNRSTFYLHYETMDDLLEEAVQYVTNKFSLQFKDIDVA